MNQYSIIIIIFLLLLLSLFFVKKFKIIDIIIFIILFVVIYILIYKYNIHDMTYVTSNIDHFTYLVRDLPDKQHAANILATLKHNILSITDYLYKNIEQYKENKSYINQLHNNIKNTIITEGNDNGVYTSYSVNKGEQLVFCIRSRMNNGELHDVNLLMYVVLHEMSHIACPEYGHTELFKKIFSFLTNIAINLKLYRKIDFTNDHTEYCGMLINESIV